MSAYVKEVNDTDFAAEVAAGVVLVDFWAPWCGPCRMQGPILDQVGAKMQGRAKVVKVNVDEAPVTASRYGIRSIPTLAVFKDGDALGALMGVQQEALLISTLERALNDESPVAR